MVPPTSARQFFLQKEKSRSGRTTGAMRVHMYKVKHIHAEMIFTHTADIFAEIVSGNVIESLAAQFFLALDNPLLPMLTSLPGLYQLVRVIMT